MISALGHSWEWWLTNAAPGIGGFASFVLVIYYSRLFRETKAQTKATQAGYTPSLDASIQPEENHLCLTAINRGQGVAKNIRLIIEVTPTYVGADSFQDPEPYSRYRSIVLFQSTLRPDKLLEGDDQDEEIKISPLFRVPTRHGQRNKRLVDLLRHQQHSKLEIKIQYQDVLEDREFEHNLYSDSIWFVDKRMLQEVRKTIQNSIGSEHPLPEIKGDSFDDTLEDAMNRDSYLYDTESKTSIWKKLQYLKYVITESENDEEETAQKMLSSFTDGPFDSSISHTWIIGSGISRSHSDLSKMERLSLAWFGTPYKIEEMKVRGLELRSNNCLTYEGTVNAGVVKSEGSN